MKVLVISVFPPAEVPDADHAYRISAHLADRGVDVHVLTQSGARVPEHPNLRLHPVMRDWRWSEMPKLLGVVRRCRPDAVLLIFVGHMYNKRPMITFAPTFAKMARPGLRFVTQFEHYSGAVTGTRHPLGPRLFHRAFRALMGRQTDWELGTLLRDSDGIITLSDIHLPFFQKAYPEVAAKSTLIPPAALMRMSPEDGGRTRLRQREALGIKPGETVFAYLGYIYTGKGLETLLEAFRRVCEQRSDVRLLIIGGTLQPGSDPAPASGYPARIHALADGMAARDKVLFTGGFDTDSDQPSRCLRAADIAVLPFDSGVQLNNSSFAGVAAHGLPIITTQGPGLESPFRDGVNLFLCPPKDGARMAEAMNSLLDDSALRHRLSGGAERLASDWFSWDKVMERMLGVLDTPGAHPLRTASESPVTEKQAS